MSRKRPTRRERETAKAMSASKTPSGGAAGWLPMDGDDELGFKQLMTHAHTGGHVDEFFSDLTTTRRAQAGKVGGLGGARLLPEALRPAVIAVWENPPETQRDIMALIREKFACAIYRDGIRGDDVLHFSDWLIENDSKDPLRLIALLERSRVGFKDWLEQFPPE